MSREGPETPQTGAACSGSLGSSETSQSLSRWSTVDWEITDSLRGFSASLREFLARCSWMDCSSISSSSGGPGSGPGSGNSSARRSNRELQRTPLQHFRGISCFTKPFCSELSSDSAVPAMPQKGSSGEASCVSVSAGSSSASKRCATGRR